MRLPSFLVVWIYNWLRRRIGDRKPDAYIGARRDPETGQLILDDQGEPIGTYMKRWWIIPRNRWFNVYFHHFLRSDDDRALHDHPWWNMSLLLRGSYDEHLPKDQVRTLYSGHLRFRTGATSHRVALHRYYECDPRRAVIHPHGIEIPVWTLFITGPKYREWGFWCPKGWKHWEEFTGERNSKDGRHNGAFVSPGCGED